MAEAVRHRPEAGPLVIPLNHVSRAQRGDVGIARERGVIKRFEVGPEVIPEPIRATEITVGRAVGGVSGQRRNKIRREEIEGTWIARTVRVKIEFERELDLLDIGDAARIAGAHLRVPDSQYCAAVTAFVNAFDDRLSVRIHHDPHQEGSSARLRFEFLGAFRVNKITFNSVMHEDRAARAARTLYGTADGNPVARFYPRRARRHPDRSSPWFQRNIQRLAR